MNNKVKYIGLESRVQYEVLESAISDYLFSGFFDKERCLYHIKQFNKGENRARKILKHINLIINRNDNILSFFIRNKESFNFTEFSIFERRIFLLCLFCNSYPIAFDIVLNCAQVFKVQSILSKSVITSKIGSLYGSNRSMHIAIIEFLPFLIECGLISRLKIGFYKEGKTIYIKNRIVYEILVYTFLHGSKIKYFDLIDLNTKSWFKFYSFPKEPFFEPSFLLKSLEVNPNTFSFTIK